MSKINSNDPVEYSVGDEMEILAKAEAIMRRTLERGEKMNDSAFVSSYVHSKLYAEKREHLIALFIDTRGRLICSRVMYSGTIDGAEIHPREIARAALECNAKSVILAHNHPSGDSSPSSADRAVTARIKQALLLLDVLLLDHIVVADGCEPVSLAAKGWV